MEIVLALIVFSFLYYQIIRFARQESVEDEFLEAVADIEARLDWAYSRKWFPFGMRAQLEVCQHRLAEARELWKCHRWQQAYRSALRSREAIDRAQRNYCRSISQRKGG